MQPRDKYNSLFMFYAEQYGVEWLLLYYQAMAESAGDPDALNPRSMAKGLAQFMDATWREWQDGTPGIQEAPPNVHLSPFDPEDAIRAQASYMAWLIKRHGGHCDTALAAYNWGTGNVKKALPDDKYDRDKVPDETRNYVALIMRGYGARVAERPRKKGDEP